jgi:hypothetical protein
MLHFPTPDFFRWTLQRGASDFLVVRSEQRDFLANCTTFATGGSGFSDPGVPPLGGAYFYLVRAEAPLVGSWGQDSAGLERVICIP